MICEICGKEFNGAAHINKKHNINTKDYYDKYIKQQNEGICPICGKPTTFKGLKIGYTKYCSVKCSQNDPVVREKVSTTYKKTMLNKYGVENPQQIQVVKDKTKQTCLERYGSEYAIGSKLVKQKIIKSNQSKYGVNYPLQSTEIRQKTIDSVKAHYGVDNPAKSDIIQEKSRQTRKNNIKNKYDTTNYVTVSDVVGLYGQGWYHERDHLGIKIVKFGMYSYIHKDDVNKAKIYYESHNYGQGSNLEYTITEFIRSIYKGEIITNTRKVIKPYELDIYIPDKKLAIEVNGIFYHSTLNGNISKNYHFNKSKMCEEKGIRLIHIYEPEWYNSEDKIKSLLRIALGKVKTKIYARNCEIRQITNKEAKPFNEKGHLQGHKQADVTYGLFYKNELVQLMSFSKNKYNRNLKSDTEWSIERGCPGSNNIVIGGVEKLFKHFIKDYNPSKIFSYCDFNKFDGNSYLAIGMKFDGYTGPDKYWVKDLQMIRRSPNKYKYYKEHADGVLYGSGSKKFIWTKGD